MTQVLKLGFRLQSVYMDVVEDFSLGSRGRELLAGLDQPVPAQYVPALKALGIQEPDKWDHWPILNGFAECEVLYDCVRRVLDQVPNVAKYKKIVLAVESALSKARTEVLKLADIPELTVGKTWESHCTEEVEQSLAQEELYYQLGAVVQYSLASIAQADKRLNWMFELVQTTPFQTSRGAPKKFSKHFLAMRLGRIFRQYNTGGHQVYVGSRANKEVGSGKNAWVNQSKFFDFASAFIREIDPDWYKTTTNDGLGQTLRRAIRKQKKYPDMDLLIHQNSTQDEMLEFMEKC